MTRVEQAQDESSPRPDESHKERVDRELEELLQELRVAIPGVQVLFAFLLTLPFSQGFTQLNGAERNMYAVAVLCSAAATGLLISPTAYHRLRFRSGEKEAMLFLVNRLSVAGLVFLSTAIAVSVFLVIEVALGIAVGVAAGIGTAGWFAVLWFFLPIVRSRGGSSSGDRA